VARKRAGGLRQMEEVMGNDSLWRPATDAEIGVPYEIRYRDALGFYSLPGRCFLHDDLQWYRIDPPTLVSRPAQIRVADPE